MKRKLALIVTAAFAVTLGASATQAATEYCPPGGCKQKIIKNSQPDEKVTQTVNDTKGKSTAVSGKPAAANQRKAPPPRSGSESTNPSDPTKQRVQTPGNGGPNGHKLDPKLYL